MRTLICVAVSVMLLATPAADARGFGGGMGRGPGGGPGRGLGGGPGGGPSPNLWGDLDFTPVVGHWAEYQMDAEDENPMMMRISIVGEEDEAYWYETVMTDDEGMQMVSKMLVSGDPQDTDNLKRMIVKPGDQPAMEMPVQMMGMMGGMGEPEGETPEPVKVDLGVELVTVPAGEFDAHHWRFTTGEDVFDAWVSEGVGPYGVVKTVTNGVAMVLAAHGDKAVSQITEEPQTLPMGGGRMGGMGRK